MNRIYEIVGSPAFQITKQEAISIAKGIGIAVAGALLTEITRQLTGASFILTWHSFQVGPAEFAAGSYNLTPLIWVGWSAFVNFARKWIPDTRTTAGKQ